MEAKQLREHVVDIEVRSQPVWIVQIIPVSGEWYAFYEDETGRSYYPVLAWALQESVYEGRKHRDVVGLVTAYGGMQDASGIAGFRCYCQSKEG